MEIDAKRLREQIDENRRSVAFDSYDLTVRQLYDMIVDEMIDIAPAYQRHFVWDARRQSQLIESLILGIPVPSLFMATNKDATWEVIDGLQRISTIINFISSENIGKRITSYYGKLKILGLEKIDEMNGAYFDDLPKSIQTMFLTRPVRVTVLNDRSDFNVRYDLFERLNTGGIILHPQEIRNCIFIGEFSEFVKECAAYQKFRHCIKLSQNAEKQGNLEELALKFFAYFEWRAKFSHSVKFFLNDYMEDKTRRFRPSDRNQMRALFSVTFDLLNEYLPDGIVRSNRKNTTPLVLYEAIAVGVADVISAGDGVDRRKLVRMLDDDRLKDFTTGATNSNKKLNQRINYVREGVQN